MAACRLLHDAKDADLAGGSGAENANALRAGCVLGVRSVTAALGAAHGRRQIRVARSAT